MKKLYITPAIRIPEYEMESLLGDYSNVRTGSVLNKVGSSGMTGSGTEVRPSYLGTSDGPQQAWDNFALDLYDGSDLNENDY